MNPKPGREPSQARSDRRRASLREAQAILVDLAASHPLVQVQAGQGGLSDECRHCGALDYGGLTHHPSCPWLRAVRYCHHRNLVRS